MTPIRTLNLLNGQHMYDFYKRTRFLDEEWMVPFNEAMCYGEVFLDLFSDEFLFTRAKVHHVSLEQYKAITLEPLKPLFDKKFDHLALWFDEDMFCQMNVLTILAWLDQTDYKGQIDLNIVEGEAFEFKERLALKAEGYYDIYKQVVLEKRHPQAHLPASLRKGVELYLDYLKQDSDLMRYIHQNKEVPENELVLKMIEKFQDYGLGDTQYLELIRAQRTTKID